MKKLILLFSIIFYSLIGNAQEKMTKEQARLICAQEMEAFTKAVSGSYQKGSSYDQFQFSLCGNLQPSAEGKSQLMAAYNFLVQGTASDVIIKNYAGKEIANSLQYLADLHKKGIESDGSELFGG